MRLIDADALIEQIRLMANRSSLGETRPADISGIEVCGLILQAPAIDAVPVVRCKDCWKRYGYQCPMYYEEYSYMDCTDDDGFCHHGERMEGELDAD